MGFFDLFRSAGKSASGGENIKPVARPHDAALRLIEQGNALEDENQLAGAMTLYEKAIRLSPDLARAHLCRGNILLARGEIDSAIAAYSKAIQCDPDYASAHFNVGNAHLQAGDIEKAQEAYKRAIALKPDFCDAYVALGCSAEELGHPEQAIENFRRALEFKPDYVEVHCNLGDTLRALGRFDDAVTSYRHALEINPDYFQALNGLTASLQALNKNDELLNTIRLVLERNPDSAESHNNMGIALQSNGQIDEALKHHHRALELNPALASGHQSLGNCLQKLGRIEDALASYRHAIELAPSLIEAHSSLGNALMELQRPDEAAIVFKSATVIKPGLAAAHYNLGTALNKLGKLDFAEACFNEALRINPDFANAYNNRGACLNNRGQYEAALKSYRRALELDPKLFQAQSNMGLVLKDIGRIDEAIICFQKALEINPYFGEAQMNLALAYSSLGQLDKALAGVRRAMGLMPEEVAPHSALLFLHNYLNDSPAATLLAEAKRFGELVARKAPVNHLPWSNTPDPERRLRIGFVSGDFRRHPVGFFVEGVLAALASSASERLEIYTYSSSFQSDAITERIKRSCDSWQSVTGISDKVVSEDIRDDEIDILIDLSGHTLYNRLAMFAWRPSPIQVTWLGYFATTGVEAIDYLIADPWTLPRSEERHFTEKIIRLPETRLCFTAPDENVDVAPLPALQEGCITFGCFNTLTKMNDAVVALWSRILKSLPTSRLFLMSHQLIEGSVLQQTKERFVAHGIDEKQLILQGFLPRKEYFEAYNKVDIALDPFPYCGGTTTVEALWMGVPVLTLAGEQFLSRQGVGLLMNAGLAEWVASDADDYVARALSHASNLQQLAALRDGLREQVLASPIFDAPRFARNFELALRGMWKDWCLRQQAQQTAARDASQT